jgi:hypothetical protein
MATRLLIGGWVLVAALGAARPAAAQSWGAHGGITAGPKQFDVGAQMESNGLAPHPELTFRPIADLGFGSGFTRLSGSLDFLFTVPFSHTWSGYVGGGPGAAYLHASGGGNTVGGTIEGIVGFKNDKNLFVEVAASHGGNPSFRATVGIMLSHRK